MVENTTFRVSGVPLYVQIREQLREQIAALKPGDMIPTESALCEQFGASRITIRKAVEDLVAEDLLVRRQGKGTFKEAPKLIHELNSISSWTEQLKALGYVARTAELSVEETTAPRQIAGMLQIGLGERVTVVRRLRLANDEPITQMVNYLPSRLVPDLAEAIQESESLYQVLSDRYQMTATHAVDTVQTRAATDTESDRLRIEAWAPVLSVTRVAYLDDGTPLEVTVAVSRGDRFEYRVKLYRSGRSTGTGAF